MKHQTLEKRITLNLPRLGQCGRDICHHGSGDGTGRSNSGCWKCTEVTKDQPLHFHTLIFFLFPESFREDEINTKPNKLNDNSMLLLTIYSNFLLIVHCVSGKLNNWLKIDLKLKNWYWFQWSWSWNERSHVSNWYPFYSSSRAVQQFVEETKSPCESLMTHPSTNMAQCKKKNSTRIIKWPPAQCLIHR